VAVLPDYFLSLFSRAVNHQNEPGFSRWPARIRVTTQHAKPK
jgi:hypothetical protein